jgi:uncharacterized protein (DUF1684 family)
MAFMLRTATAVLLAGLAAACGPVGDPGAMVRIPPPPAWELELAGERRARDEQFRVSRDSPLPERARESFSGLDYYEPSPEYYFVGPVHRHASPQRLTLITTAGQERPAEKYGWVAFPVDGQSCTLQVYRLLDGAGGDDVEQMFVPFRDGTTGEETYPAGRYVNLRGAVGGPWVLDFNSAYNPSCAYGEPERFACPVTPAENRLPVRIEAGERGYRERAAAGG